MRSRPSLPSNIVLVTDPDYTVTNLYGLRWDAPHETAYPSTFVLDKKGMIVFEKISHSHGDRLSAQDALDHLARKLAVHESCVRRFPEQPFFLKAESLFMLRIGNRLFLALALLMFQPVSYAQLRELGSGAPGPVKAQHLTAELISDSGAVAPGSDKQGCAAAYA